MGPEEDDTSGLSGSGMLVNIEPTTAQSTFHVKKGAENGIDDAVGSHPLLLTNRNLSGDLQIEEERARSSTMSKTLNVRTTVNLEHHMPGSGSCACMLCVPAISRLASAAVMAHVCCCA